MRHGPPCSAGRRARRACLPQFTRVCHAWWPVAAPPHRHAVRLAQPPPERFCSAPLAEGAGADVAHARPPRMSASCRERWMFPTGPALQPVLEWSRHEAARQAAAELVLKTEHWPGTNLCSPCEARGAGALRSEPQAYSVKTDDKTFLAERAQRVTPVCRAA